MIQYKKSHGGPLACNVSLKDIMTVVMFTCKEGFKFPKLLCWSASLRFRKAAFTFLLWQRFMDFAPKTDKKGSDHTASFPLLIKWMQLRKRLQEGDVLCMVLYVGTWKSRTDVLLLIAPFLDSGGLFPHRMPVLELFQIWAPTPCFLTKYASPFCIMHPFNSWTCNGIWGEGGSWFFLCLLGHADAWYN